MNLQSTSNRRRVTAIETPQAEEGGVVSVVGRGNAIVVGPISFDVR
jgi:hypothetical protein